MRVSFVPWLVQLLPRKWAAFWKPANPSQKSAMALPHYPGKKTPFQSSIHRERIVKAANTNFSTINSKLQHKVRSRCCTLCFPGPRGSVPCTSWEAATSPQNLLPASDMAGHCLHSAPFTAQLRVDNGLDFPFTATFILSALRYHQWQGKCQEISLTVLSDIWLQTALAYPTPRPADNFKGTGSPFSCFCCPNNSFSKALVLARLYTKCISVTLCTGLGLKEEFGLLGWQAQTLRWANLLEIEVFWTFQIIFVCSRGPKIGSR